MSTPPPAELASGDATDYQQWLTTNEIGAVEIGKVTRTHHALVHRPYEYILKVKQKFEDQEGGRVSAQFEKLPEAIGGILQNKCVVALRGMLLLAALVALPYVYAQVILAYPCQWTSRVMKDVGSSSEHNVKLQIDPDECELQDFLRSPYSLALGLALICVLALLFALEQAYMAVMGSCAGPTQVIQVLFHSYLRPKLSKIAFTKYPSWVAVLGWMVLVLEFVSIAVIQHKYAIGALIAYALGEVFCKMVNHGVGASAAYVAILEAEMKALPTNTLGYKVKGADVGTVWMVFSTDGRTLPLTLSQIKILVDLFPYDDDYALHDFRTGEAWIKEVFCLDTHKMYKLSDTDMRQEAQALAEHGFKALSGSDK